MIGGKGKGGWLDTDLKRLWVLGRDRWVGRPTNACSTRESASALWIPPISCEECKVMGIVPNILQLKAQVPEQPNGARVG